MYKDRTVGVIILAAGRSSRMGEGINKVFRQVLGKPVLAHSIDSFLGTGVVDEFVFVYNEEEKDLLEENALAYLDSDSSNQDLSVKYVPGGEKRQDSSMSGVEIAESDYVCIHDGARPNFSTDLVVRLLEATNEEGAAFPGVKPVDTIRKNNDGYAGSTVDRNGLVKVQTPQCFERKTLLSAMERAAEKGWYFTDDAGIVMEFGGARPRIVEGERGNVKITTARDAILIEGLMKT
jgi:2-C-methyl-D-erythritol 4-phosphate cytidylyltransferase